ncbi:MAG: hypothetical protein A3I66_06440 [Burkholderiales bacterium RIFCSPLOWO2_02_FULL_57_36]|nr:MAG: hypothetical protein A3I66_06440 [Burkholderiales bacterium RIFCSPLOWO2_02_FULL_57_36]
MLIMVDGRRNTAALLAQNPDRAEAESYLAALLDGGFIHAAIQPSVAPAENPPPPAPAVDIGTVKQYINSTLHSLLGPDADMFTVKVDAANDMPTLLTLSVKLHEVIQGIGGKKKADDFKEKISSLLV